MLLFRGSPAQGGQQQSKSDPAKKGQQSRGERTTFWAKTTTERLKKKVQTTLYKPFWPCKASKPIQMGLPAPIPLFSPSHEDFIAVTPTPAPSLPHATFPNLPAPINPPRSSSAPSLGAEQISGQLPRPVPGEQGPGYFPPPEFSSFFLTRAGAHLAFSARRPRAVSSCCLSSGSPGPEPAAGRSPASLGGNTKG